MFIAQAIKSTLHVLSTKLEIQRDKQWVWQITIILLKMMSQGI
jgi:hypothetical protein